MIALRDQRDLILVKIGSDMQHDRSSNTTVHSSPAGNHSRPSDHIVHGFTLMELLVVTAVIAVLVGVLVPGLQEGVRIAGQVYCQANLAQAAKGWLLYLDDHHGAFYQGVNANLDYGGWIGMWGLRGNLEWTRRPLNPYVGLPRIIEDIDGAPVFRCPQDCGGVPTYRDLICSDVMGTSYQTNIFLIGQTQISLNPPRLRPLHREINHRLPKMNISRASEPSRLILMGEYGWMLQWGAGLPSSPESEWHGVPATFTVAFLDGHADFLRIRKGLYVTDQYRVLPFAELDALAIPLQQEEP